MHSNMSPPGNIEEKAIYLDETQNSLKPVTSELSDNETQIMKLGYDIYGQFNGWQLFELTHRKGTPWHATWNEKGKNFHGVTIPNAEIATHFKKDIIDKYL